MPSFLIALTFAAAFAQPHAQPLTPTPAQATEAATEDSAVTALALKIYSQMRAGKIDEALLSEEMKKALTPEVVAKNKPVFDQLGDPTKLTLESRKSTPQGTAYDYLAQFATAQLHIRLFLDSAGKVGGYYVTP